MKAVDLKIGLVFVCMMIGWVVVATLMTVIELVAKLSLFKRFYMKVAK